MFARTFGAEPPLLPPPLRRPMIAVVAAAAVVSGVLAVRYQGGSGSRWLDVRLHWLVSESGLRDSGPLKAVVWLGNALPVVVLAVLLCGLAVLLHLRRLALLALIGPGLTGGATTLLKPLIGRTFHGDLAYPSGHAGGATALGLVAALLLINVLRVDMRTSALIVAAMTVMTGGTMAVALIIRREHYPTDTAGGFCTAIAVVLGCAMIIDRIAAARSEAGGAGSPQACN